MNLSTLGKAAIGVGASIAGSAVVSAIGAKARDALVAKVSEDSLSAVIMGAKNVLGRQQAGDLITYSQAARVEPILLMDEKATYVPFIQDVVHTMSSIFTAYYLQSVALDTTLSGVKVTKRLDKFNPDRNLNNATMALLNGESNYSKESMALGLPFHGYAYGLEAYGEPGKVALEQISLENKVPLTFEQQLSKAMDNAEIKQRVEAIYGKKDPTEAEVLEKARRDARVRQAIEEEFAKSPELVSGVALRDVNKLVTDISNLAVGQMIEITITENGQSAKIPVSVRLRVTGMPSDVLVQTMSVGGVDVTAKTRFRQWRAGELRFWADIILAQDRIDAHRQAVLKDQSGFYKAINDRANKNLLAEVMGSGPSVGTASAIIVFTEQTKKDLERNINGRLSDFKTRQGVFASTYSMLMAVVDPEWETVTIYHRGIELPTELSAKDLKAAGKGNGPDVAEILKAYQLGSAPSRL